MRHRWITTIAVCAVLAGLAGLLILAEYFGAPPPAGELLEGKLTQVQGKALDLSIDLTRLFSTSAQPLTRAELVMVELVVTASIVSIFFGHLAITALTESLALDLLALREGPHAVYETLQYLLFLASLVGFGVFLHLTHWRATRAKEQ